MQFKWNEKINQVTENTLVVGIDIAKRVHYACFVDQRGRVIEKAFAVHQSKEGWGFLQHSVRVSLLFTRISSEWFGQSVSHTTGRGTPIIRSVP